MPPSGEPQPFVMAPHPYIIVADERVFDDEALALFHALLVQRFGLTLDVPYYRIAQELDIHRAVLDAWLGPLAKLGAIVLGIDYIGLSDAGGVIVDPDLSLAQAYDPLVDREHDEYMTGYYAIFPFFVIDKYFHIAHDEVLACTCHQRIRPDGKTFKPLPRSYITKSTNHPAWTPFDQVLGGTGYPRGTWPREWYDDLCAAAAKGAIHVARDRGHLVRPKPGPGPKAGTGPNPSPVKKLFRPV